jgi:hypothetical protein
MLYININNYCLDHDIEIREVKLEMSKSNIYIFSIYKAPSGNFMNFILKLGSILKHYMYPNTGFIICGDISTMYLADAYRKIQTHYLFHITSLIQLTFQLEFKTLQSLPLTIFYTFF